MKTILAAGALVLSLVCVTDFASAGYPYADHGRHFRQSYSNYPYRVGNSYYRSRYTGMRGHYDWHDTSHYDYVPGGFVPSPGGYIYRPPTYLYHQDGHWDYHRGGHHHHW